MFSSKASSLPNTIRYCWIAFVCCTLYFTGSLSAASRAELIYDGNLIQKTEINTFHGREYIPLKAIATLFKGKTQWYPIAGKVVLQLKNHKIMFVIDERTAMIGDKKVSLSGPARLVKGKIFVPIDFFLTEPFTEIADCTVTWNHSGQMLTAESRASLSPPRIYSRSNFTRIVIESREKLAPEVKQEEKEILVEIPKVRAAEEQVKIDDTVVKTIKVVQVRRGVSIKVTLANPTTAYSWFQERDPHRFILEVYNPKALPSKPEKLTELILPHRDLISTQTAVPQALPVRSNGSILEIKKIVVDAGHGGKDPGAIGRLGTKEKDINLLIALELARILRIEGGYEVLLTRSSDSFISLIDRTLFANDQKADLFISIHCNAALRKKEGGFEVYFLAEDSSDPHAEAAAEFENAVIELEGPTSPQKKKLQELLYSMVQTEFINESSLLCNTIAKAVEKKVSIGNRGVKQADFHVLHGAQMPSILIESAFLTNPAEEKKLRQKKFRSAMVDAILIGIDHYQKQLQRLRG